MPYARRLSFQSKPLISLKDDEHHCYNSLSSHRLMPSTNICFHAPAISFPISQHILYNALTPIYRFHYPSFCQLASARWSRIDLSQRRGAYAKIRSPRGHDCHDFTAPIAATTSLLMATRAPIIASFLHARHMPAASAGWPHEIVDASALALRLAAD